MIPTLLGAPATEPISLDEAKAWLRVDASDEDQLISALIVSARLTLEAYTRRFFVTQSWRMTLDAWPAATARRKTLSVPFAPFQSVSAIRVLDATGVAQTLDAEDYRAPAAPDRGRIVFAEAPTSTPEPLRRALLALVAHWHENRGDEPAETARLPALVAALASPFRRERLA